VTGGCGVRAAQQSPGIKLSSQLGKAGEHHGKQKCWKWSGEDCIGINGGGNVADSHGSKIKLASPHAIQMAARLQMSSPVLGKTYFGCEHQYKAALETPACFAMPGHRCGVCLVWGIEGMRCARQCLMLSMSAPPAHPFPLPPLPQPPLHSLHMQSRLSAYFQLLPEMFGKRRCATAAAYPLPSEVHMPTNPLTCKLVRSCPTPQLWQTAQHWYVSSKYPGHALLEKLILLLGCGGWLHGVALQGRQRFSHVGHPLLVCSQQASPSDRATD